MESNGRKKHVVTGEVSEIKKREADTEVKPVGSRTQRGSFLTNLIKGLTSKEK